MITDFILDAVFAALSVPLNLIPTIGFDWAGTTWGPLLEFANIVFPIAEFFAMMSALLGALLVLTGVWAVMKLIDWMPFT